MSRNDTIVEYAKQHVAAAEDSHRRLDSDRQVEALCAIAWALIGLLEDRPGPWMGGPK